MFQKRHSIASLASTDTGSGGQSSLTAGIAAAVNRHQQSLQHADLARRGSVSTLNQDATVGSQYHQRAFGGAGDPLLSIASGVGPLAYRMPMDQAKFQQQQQQPLQGSVQQQPHTQQLLARRLFERRSRHASSSPPTQLPASAAATVAMLTARGGSFPMPLVIPSSSSSTLGFGQTAAAAAAGSSSAGLASAGAPPYFYGGVMPGGSPLAAVPPTSAAAAFAPVSFLSGGKGGGRAGTGVEHVRSRPLTGQPPHHRPFPSPPPPPPRRRRDAMIKMMSDRFGAELRRVEEQRRLPQQGLF
ncbi:hypothetical protein DFJ73DRAFT_839330, partial [Zopfochytrium polystomum]